MRERAWCSEILDAMAILTSSGCVSDFTVASSLQRVHCSDKLLNEWAIKTSKYLVADTVVVIVQFVGFCVTNYEIVADEVNLLSIIHDHPRS